MDTSEPYCCCRCTIMEPGQRYILRVYLRDAFNLIAIPRCVVYDALLEAMGPWWELYGSCHLAPAILRVHRPTSLCSHCFQKGTDGRNRYQEISHTIKYILHIIVLNFFDRKFCLFWQVKYKYTFWIDFIVLSIWFHYIGIPFICELILYLCILWSTK